MSVTCRYCGKVFKDEPKWTAWERLILHVAYRHQKITRTRRGNRACYCGYLVIDDYNWIHHMVAHWRDCRDDEQHEYAAAEQFVVDKLRNMP